MKTMQAALLQAYSNRSHAGGADANELFDEFRTRDRKDGTPASPATALAIKGLPVPGGLTRSPPFEIR